MVQDGGWHLGATTLGAVKEGEMQVFNLMHHLLGINSGSMGETSALLLTLGGLWLIQQRVSWHVPVAALVGCLLPGTLLWCFAPGSTPLPLAQLTSGGLLLGAFLLLRIRSPALPAAWVSWCLVPASVSWSS